MAENVAKPKRRARYRGTHPRRFEHKYKEHNPERYAEDVKKILAKGSTPAGTHRPICVDEILTILSPQPGEILLDATLGYGGHASILLPKLLPGGRLIGIDQDPIERPKTEARLRQPGIPADSLLIGAINFCDARKFLKEHHIAGVDMVLADLGVSSMQIDDPTRGFSFKTNSPLDLRMNPNQGESAADLLRRISEDELMRLLRENADEPRARVMAKAIVKTRPQTTAELNKTIRRAMRTLPVQIRLEERDKPIRRIFQALRIAVNDEFKVLAQFVKDLPEILNPGGRVAILSFHSGEDRLVKKSFQAGERARLYSRISAEITRPSIEEQRFNPRSKSAKLRWAVKA